jgi:hypothetical protein
MVAAAFLCLRTGVWVHANAYTRERARARRNPVKKRDFEEARE